MNNVLVDTSVWSLAFRRNKLNEKDAKVVNELISLIRNMQIVLIGPIRQELLSGISNQSDFENLKNKMNVFKDFRIQTVDYERAAEYSNICRKHGIQGSHTDFLICSVAFGNEWEIFTEDKDFLNYEKYLPICLYHYV
jgi:predicted nucleic acid-binding protein